MTVLNNSPKQGWRDPGEVSSGTWQTQTCLPRWSIGIWWSGVSKMGSNAIGISRLTYGHQNLQLDGNFSEYRDQREPRKQCAKFLGIRRRNHRQFRELYRLEELPCLALVCQRGSSLGTWYRLCKIAVVISKCSPRISSKSYHREAYPVQRTVQWRFRLYTTRL